MNICYDEKMKDNQYNTGHEYDQERGEMAEMERLERDYQEMRQGHSELMAQNKYLRDLNAELLAALTELVDSPNAKQNAMWDRARDAIAKAGRSRET